MVRVRVSEGVLEGEIVENEYGGTYCSFKGLPYAEPPIGDLRFKAPQPPKPWDGVRNAKVFGSTCYQRYFFVSKPPHGSEDCLYLNVYTPTVTPDCLLPVMFWIHGGVTTSGSGNDNLYGPEFLVRHGVILVTFNYRLDHLGFLCLETADVPGNAGLKDQVAALRWVCKNISNFGGDPCNITIFGEGAGAACVGYHLVSPMTKRLFSKAILQSGAATCWWSFTTKPRERALLLAKELEYYSEDDKELYEFFKSLPAELLVGPMPSITLARKTTQTVYENAIVVVSEKEFENNERFFYGEFSSENLANVHEGVTVYTGYTKDEGLICISRDLPIKFAQLNIFYEEFVPPPIAWNCVIEDQLKFGKQIKEYYFNDRRIGIKEWRALTNFYTTYFFKYNILQWVKTVASLNKTKVYLYKFGCKTERNSQVKDIGLRSMIRDETVVSHGDDLFYLFNARDVEEKPSKETKTFKVIDRVTTLWTNIAKYGDPTPDDSLGVKWLPYTAEYKDCLNIGNELQTGVAPDEDEFTRWNRMLQHYAPQFAFPTVSKRKQRRFKKEYSTEPETPEEKDGPRQCCFALQRWCVRISEGNIEGDVIENPFGGIYYSFKGIPYAEPPIGDLRFKDPQPPKSWKGTRSAKEFGSSCYQPDFLNLAQPNGSEDCLYLNIYTPTMDPATPLPVMFWIQGGGNDKLYGPEFLVKHGVILVTFSYRVGNLGFLSLETADIPGNAGMKDQVAALLWVMKNISKFGGDLDNITIFGQGSGAACVGYHLISPMTKGLFKRAILQSGAATCWWSYNKNPRERALALAKQLGCYSKDDKELYEFFKSQPLEALMNNKASLTIAESAVTTDFGLISVVSEKSFNTNEHFFCSDFTSKSLANIHEGVTVYAGYTNEEGLLNIAIGADLETKVNQFNHFYELFVPPPITWSCVIGDQLEFGRQIKKYYFDERKIEIEDWPALANFYATYFFKYNILHWIKSITKLEKNNVYLYKFNCVTERNVVTKMIGLQKLIKNEQVACHADDLFYLFNAKSIEEKAEIKPETLKVIDQVTKLWTNIAKNGDPTPDDSLEVKWIPYSNKHQKYLNIGNDLKPGTALDEDEFNHWNKTTRLYARQLAFRPTKVVKNIPLKEIRSRNLTPRPKPVCPTDSDPSKQIRSRNLTPRPKPVCPTDSDPSKQIRSRNLTPRSKPVCPTDSDPSKQIRSRNLTPRSKPVDPTDSDPDEIKGMVNLVKNNNRVKIKYLPQNKLYVNGMEVNLRYETWERYQDFWEEAAQKKKHSNKRHILTTLQRNNRAPP